MAITESRPGPVDTIVRVTGPAGEAELRVRGYVATAPQDAARAAAKLAREDISDPFQQALVLTAAAWAAHVTADAESVTALLADAEAAAQQVHDSRPHFLALAATNLLAARCGDDQRAAGLIGNLASLIHVAMPDPMGRALLLAGLGLFGRLVAPAKARECHPGVATIGRAVRWATAEINESQRVEALFDDARDAARATASPAERAQAELGVSWLSSLGGKASEVPLSTQLAAVVLTSGAEPDAMATLLLSVMLLDAASSTPMTSLVARPDDRRFLVSTGKDLFDLATARQPIGGGHRYLFSASEALRKQLNLRYRPIRYILEAAFYHRSGNRQASADRLKLALAGDAELPEITPTALIIVAAIQHATGDDAAARATLLSADAAAARIGDPDLLTVQLWLGCVVARLAGADDIARQLAIAAEAVADSDTPDERPLNLALAALCAETAGAPNTAILERATSGLEDMDDIELRAFTRVLITWMSRPQADADGSRQLFDELVQFVDAADVPLRSVIVLLAAFSAAGRDVRIPGAELFDALFGFHEDAQHARNLLTEARAAAAGTDDAERLPTMACLALAAHTLGDRGLRTELLRETADLLGRWPGLPWLPWLARLAVAWLSMLDGDLQAIPTTVTALLSYARDADDPLEAASLQLAAALTQALTGQLDEAQQTLVAAHTTIDQLTEPAQAKSLVLAAAAWVGALAQTA